MRRYNLPKIRTKFEKQYITSSIELNALQSSECSVLNPLKSGDHSEVVPLLPIPNRTVKHLSADDSADYLCESRSSPDTLKSKPRYRKISGFLLCAKEKRRGMSAGPL